MIGYQTFFIGLAALMLWPCISLAESSAATTCPACPAGCVPGEMVESFKSSAPESPNVCPEGCVPIVSVKSFLDPSPCEPATATAPAPAPAAAPIADTTEAKDSTDSETRQKKSVRNVDRTGHRITAFPTAKGLKPKEYVVTGYGAGVWEFQAGVTEHIQAGLVTMLPVGFWGIAPTVRGHGKIGDYFYLSGGLHAGYWGTFADFGNLSVLFFGGSTELSAVIGDHTINLGINAFTGKRGNKGWDGHGVEWTFLDGVILVPHLGYRVAFHDNWSFQTEFTVPLFITEDIKPGGWNWTTYVLFFYGFRGHGDMLFGDIGFCLPLSEPFVDHLWRYFPLGFPYFSLGFMF